MNKNLHRTPPRAPADTSGTVPQKHSRQEAMVERYAERFPGWRRSKAKHCPRVVAGKHCLADGFFGEPCVCVRLRRTTYLFDHVCMWFTPDGEHVLTMEPYGVTPQELAALRANCHTLGLVAELHDQSPYNPGATKLLIARRAGDASQRKAANGRMAAGEQRQMLDERICYVCRTPVPEGSGCAWYWLGIVHHTDTTCGSILRSCLRDYSRSPRGRKLPRARILERIRGSWLP